MKALAQAIPTVEVAIGEETFQVKCSFGLLARFQKATGKNPFDSELWTKPSPLDFAGLLWAGIVPFKPQWTIDDVADQLSIGQLGQVHEVVLALMSSATSSVEKKIAEPELKEAQS
jgi:hypothetical protein